MVLRVSVFGFRVKDVGFRVQVLGHRVEGSGSRVEGFGSVFRVTAWVLECRVQGSKLRP
jgi:hypothetical protein